MTPRITKEGNSVTVAEPSEYERLCEALSISVQRAISLNPSESTNILIGVWRDLEEAHPAAARAIRDGMERAKAKASEFLNDDALSGETVAVYRGPIVENPPQDCGWFTYILHDGPIDDAAIEALPPEDLSAPKKIASAAEEFEKTKRWEAACKGVKEQLDKILPESAPPPEDLSALKKRIGWDRKKAEGWVGLVKGTIALGSDDDWLGYWSFGIEVAKAMGVPNGESIVPAMQALLDHEDE